MLKKADNSGRMYGILRFTVIFIFILLPSQVMTAPNNADLENLQIKVTGGAVLTPFFSSDQTMYHVKVDNDIKRVYIRVYALASASKLSVNKDSVDAYSWYPGNLSIGENRFEITVTAPDGKTTKAYFLYVSREDLKSLTDKFLKFIYQDEATGLSMSYRLFVPDNYDPKKSYPLVLFLHGGGERGADNELQLHGTMGAAIWAKPEEQAKRPCFVLVPQAHPSNDPDPRIPYTGFGITRDKDSNRYMELAFTPSEDLKLAVKILERVQKEYSVDSSRLYVTGLSQGGFGTWNINLMHPKLFAAMVPTCGGGDPAQAYKLINKPIWAFHAEDDPVIPVSYSRNIISMLRSKGGKPLYTEYPSGTYIMPYEHFSWVLAYKNEQMREWLFNQVNK